MGNTQSQEEIKSEAYKICKQFENVSVFKNDTFSYEDKEKIRNFFKKILSEQFSSKVMEDLLKEGETIEEKDRDDFESTIKIFKDLEKNLNIICDESIEWEGDEFNSSIQFISEYLKEELKSQKKLNEQFKDMNKNLDKLLVTLTMNNLIGESFDIYKKYKSGENLSNEDLSKVKDNKDKLTNYLRTEKTLFLDVAEIYQNNLNYPKELLTIQKSEDSSKEEKQLASERYLVILCIDAMTILKKIPVISSN